MMRKLLKSTYSAKLISRICTILILGALLFSSLTTSADAATLSISPSSGSYSGSFSFDVVINLASGEQMAAVDLNINYTGPVEFVTATSGAQNCTPSVSAQSGRVNVLCASLDYFQTGSVVRLTFVANGSGTANFSVEVVDSDGNITGSTGAAYTVNGTGGQGGGGGNLPNTALLDMKSAGLGTFLLGIGLSSLLLGYVINRAPSAEYYYEDRKLGDKVK